MEFFNYVRSFYGDGGIYNLGYSDNQIQNAINIYLACAGDNYCGDSVDRERVRLILEGV